MSSIIYLVEKEFHASHKWNLQGIPVFRSYMTIGDRRYKGFYTFIACASVSQRYIVLFPEFFRMSKRAQDVIIYHELGHLLGYSEEEDADAYAISMTSKEAYKEAVSESVRLRKLYALSNNQRNILD